MELECAVREGYANDEMRADFEKLCKWVGGLQNVGSLAGRLTIEQHEQLARGLEAYFLKGKAPSEELRGVFATRKEARFFSGNVKASVKRPKRERKMARKR